MQVPETSSQSELAETLKQALFHGRLNLAQDILTSEPEVARSNFGLMCALYDVEGVANALRQDRSLALQSIGPRVPIQHLTFSRWIKGPGLLEDLIAVAELLRLAGADLNAQYDSGQGMLSALYGAISHAQSLPLVEWLLEHGVDPNDGESMYHGCEFGDASCLKLLLAYGAKTERTNVLPRALDFNNIEMVRVLLEAGADPNEGINWPEDSGEAPWVIAALHQAGRRMCSGEIGRALLEAGADTDAFVWGHTAYALARIHGNRAVADEIEAFGGNTTLTKDEQILVNAVGGGEVTEKVNPEALDARTRDIVRNVVHLPNGFALVKALVGAGLEFDRPDPSGLPPVQIAGWEGLPDIMEYLLSLGPNLEHKNGYGGDLLGTILHGASFTHARRARDHIACLKLALEAGVLLPKGTIEVVEHEAAAAFLKEWAKAHPEQVTDG